jgi:N-acetylated-alpha-linked acidic dipeptidase
MLVCVSFVPHFLPVITCSRADVSVSGSQFRAFASPSLAHLVRQAAEDIPHPTSGDIAKSLWDATNDRGTFFGDRCDSGQSVSDPEAIAVHEMEYGPQQSLGVGALGSGSDYTVFLQRIGVCVFLLIFPLTIIYIENFTGCKHGRWFQINFV